MHPERKHHRRDAAQDAREPAQQPPSEIDDDEVPESQRDLKRSDVDLSGPGVYPPPSRPGKA